jgi:hypothetical protein
MRHDRRRIVFGPIDWPNWTFLWACGLGVVSRSDPLRYPFVDGARFVRQQHLSPRQARGRPETVGFSDLGQAGRRHTGATSDVVVGSGT